MIGLPRGTVTVEAYDPEWPGFFTRERIRLQEHAAEYLSEITHIGSTAIPGMPSKPIIDMVATADSITPGAVARLTEVLKPLGYEYRANGSSDARALFVLGPESRRTHHLSVVGPESVNRARSIQFCEHMRTHSSDAARYSELKQELAAQHPNDRAAYTRAKETFIQSINYSAAGLLL